MLLPAGVNKASGLRAALRRLNLSEHNAVGVGDGENDHTFLEICEMGVATANAVDSLKAQADLVLQRPKGAGVTQLAQRLLADDLKATAPARRRIPYAKSENGEEVFSIPISMVRCSSRERRAAESRPRHSVSSSG